jgi:Flp pilus assembly protein TadG
MSVNKRYVKNLQEGAALVEFAIIVPLLLLLVVGISEFGFAFYHLNILNKSVQDGARYISDSQIARYDGTGSNLSNPINVSTTTNGTNITNTQQLVIYGNIAGTGNALMPPNNGSGYVFAQNSLSIPTANHIQLTVQYNHNFILGSVLYNLCKLISTNNTSCVSQNGTYSLTASSVLRVE